MFSNYEEWMDMLIFFAAATIYYHFLSYQSFRYLICKNKVFIQRNVTFLYKTGVNTTFKTAIYEIPSPKLRHLVIHTFTALALNAVFSKLVHYSDMQKICLFEN